MTEKYYLIRINHSYAGFFAYLTFVINQLLFCERRGLIPVVYFGPWSEDGPNAYHDPAYGDNMWDYYFEPVAGITFAEVQCKITDANDPMEAADFLRMSNDKLWDIHTKDKNSVYPYPFGRYKYKTILDRNWYRANRQKAHEVIKKYIRLKPHISELVDNTAFGLFAGQQVLGIQMRGTDKGTADVLPEMQKVIPPEDYYPYIDRYVQANPDCKLFIATDQVQFVGQIRERYGDRLLSLDVARADGNINVFQDHKTGSGYKKGEEVLLDCLLLSRCHTLLKCCSAVGEFAIYFNPDLPCLDLNHAYAQRQLDERVRHSKTRRAAGKFSYTAAPKVSFIIQSFNHQGNIDLIAERLRALPYQETIVCEDGSVDRSLEAWINSLDRPNDIVIRTNDLHEIRTYDRALHLAKGEIVCLLQDDDAPPASPAWFDEALALFQRHPKLVILGGYMAFRGLDSEDPPYPGDLTRLYDVDDMTPGDHGGNFRFVEAINVGPVFLRREKFIELGGFDLDYSAVGWPGIHFDVEMSLRTWLAGGQVAWYDAGFRQAGKRGTESFGNMDKRLQQLARNHDKLRTGYGGQITQIQSLVEAAEEGRGNGLP